MAETNGCQNVQQEHNDLQKSNGRAGDRHGTSSPFCRLKVQTVVGPIVPAVRLKRKSRVDFLSSCGGVDAGQRLLLESLAGQGPVRTNTKEA